MEKLTARRRYDLEGAVATPGSGSNLGRLFDKGADYSFVGP
jgi:hypothetical protein